jgi:arylsulfatase A-like enzyme
MPFQSSVRIFFLAMSMFCVLVPSVQAAKPNVLFICADDLGWGETGAYGCREIPMPHFQNEARPHVNMFWRFGDQWAVRSGDWKLVVSKVGSGSPELYNLADDRSESKDLASTETTKIAHLQKLYDASSAEQAAPTASDNKQKKKKGGTKKKKKASSAASV